MDRAKVKRKKKELRHHRVRAKVTGTKKRPRVSISRSNQHIFVQFIDDEKAKTILSLSDIKLPKDKTTKKNKTEIAALLGKEIGEQAKKAGIKNIVLDRGGFAYHGRVKSIADGLRDAGLSF